MKREKEKLFGAHNFLEILEGELVRSFVEFFTGMGICKVSDTETVCGVQLAHEELAAGLPHGDNLEDG